MAPEGLSKKDIGNMLLFSTILGLDDTGILLSTSELVGNRPIRRDGTFVPGIDVLCFVTDF
jgi:hypothetical protein